MSEKKHVYIAGPMRGIAEFNFPAFFAAEEKLKAKGYAVFNPARRDTDVYGMEVWKSNTTGSIEQAERDTGFSLREALGADLAWICSTATAIYMLKGWENSAGATAERATAIALGLEVMYE